jgi:uncharacterized damage-inducible protein DinB
MAMRKPQKKTTKAKKATRATRAAKISVAAKSKSAAKSRAAKPAARKAAPVMPSPKQQFLNAFGKEHSTTLKVIRALPGDQGAFQPHPRSQSAKTLIWTFTVEQGLTVSALKGTLTMPPTFPPVPETLAEAIAAFERAAAETIETVKRTPDSRFHASSPFFTGPGKIGEVPNLDLLWLMLSDQIHHRGQLSVYVRMAGGKVPSIYGPSADEPWM